MRYASLSPQQARSIIRENGDITVTSGVSLGFAQVNLAIVPERYASDFNRFCTLNAKACPVLHVGEPGEFNPQSLGDGIDVRKDVAGYHLLRHGRFTEEVSDISSYWEDDFVTFYIGCSFSFEEALIDNGIAIPHIDADINVPMYRSNIPMKPSGPFSGSMVVSLRALKPADVIKAVQVTTDMPMVHGAPVHLGDPNQIGIKNIHSPDFGDAPILADGHLNTFWACGVSAQVALASANLPFTITHAPGKMLITDVPNWKLRYG